MSMIIRTHTHTYTLTHQKPYTHTHTQITTPTHPHIHISGATILPSRGAPCPPHRDGEKNPYFGFTVSGPRPGWNAAPPHSRGFFCGPDTYQLWWSGCY